MKVPHYHHVGYHIRKLTVDLNLFVVHDEICTVRAPAMGILKGESLEKK